MSVLAIVNHTLTSSLLPAPLLRHVLYPIQNKIVQHVDRHSLRKRKEIDKPATPRGGMNFVVDRRKKSILQCTRSEEPCSAERPCNMLFEMNKIRRQLK